MYLLGNGSLLHIGRIAETTLSDESGLTAFAFEKRLALLLIMLPPSEHAQGALPKVRFLAARCPVYRSRMRSR